MPGGDLDIAQVNPGIQHGRDEGVPEHVGVWPGDPYACVLGEVAQAAGGGVPVHPGAAAVEQDRPAGPVRDGAVNGPADCRGQRDQDHLGALAAYAKDAVAVFFAQVGDAGAGGFEDPQAQQPEPGHQGEVVVVR